MATQLGLVSAFSRLRPWNGVLHATALIVKLGPGLRFAFRLVNPKSGALIAAGSISAHSRDDALNKCIRASARSLGPGGRHIARITLLALEAFWKGSRFIGVRLAEIDPNRSHGSRALMVVPRNLACDVWISQRDEYATAAARREPDKNKYRLVPTDEGLRLLIDPGKMMTLRMTEDRLEAGLGLMADCGLVIRIGDNRFGLPPRVTTPGPQTNYANR